MNAYGLREARTLIAADRKSIAAEFPRSSDPYVRGMRDALKALDNRIALRLEADLCHKAYDRQEKLRKRLDDEFSEVARTQAEKLAAAIRAAA